MRDGEFLAGNLFLPIGDGQFPVILIQTPYNKDYYTSVGLPINVGFNIDFSPYAFVIADWRCFWGSTAACTPTLNRGEDGYDTVEWIAEQDWCDGNIGTWGPSALGNVQFETANEQPPHLKCAVPVVASPGTNYEKYYPGGALRTEYFEMLSFLFGAVSNFQLITNNPYQNFIWNFATTLGFEPANINIPMFMVAGWYDHNTEENLELFEILRSQSAAEVQNLHRIVIGPWVHGGTGQANVGSSVQGELEYPMAAQEDSYMARYFFDNYLRNLTINWQGTANYTYLKMGEDEWLQAQNWPPDTDTRSFYLNEDNLLSEEFPVQNGLIDYQYDPEDPSPTIGGKTLKFGLNQGPYDQRFDVENRSDALVFSTQELNESISIDGKVKVVLKVGTDQLDTDFTVRLCDVYPDGRSMLLGEGIQRLRFRSGDYSSNGEEFASPDDYYEIEIFFESLSIRFLEGHKIRLIVSSSNYPRYNRNMNTGAEMYPNSNPDTLVNPIIATNQLLIGDLDISSRIELPIVTISSTEELINQSSIKIFPNPANQYFSIELPNTTEIATLHMFDAAGQLVMIVNNLRNNDAVNTAQLAPGFYTLQLVYNDKIDSSKLLIQH